MRKIKVGDIIEIPTKEELLKRGWKCFPCVGKIEAYLIKGPARSGVDLKDCGKFKKVISLRWDGFIAAGGWFFSLEDLGCRYEAKELGESELRLAKFIK